MISVKIHRDLDNLYPVIVVSKMHSNEAILFFLYTQKKKFSQYRHCVH